MTGIKENSGSKKQNKKNSTETVVSLYCCTPRLLSTGMMNPHCQLQTQPGCPSQRPKEEGKLGFLILQHWHSPHYTS